MIPYKNVFLVDDCPFFLKLCEKNLLKNGFINLHVFNSGEELLKHLDLKPDIIFLDYHLNDYTGNELLYKIKAFNPNILVVMISSQESMEVTIDLLNNGAFDYIIKDDNFIDKLSDVSYKLVSVFSSQQKSSGCGFDNFSEKEYKNIVLNAQEKVRMKISNELHDNISQLLGSSKLYLETATKDSVNRLELLKESKSILESAITEIRNMSHNLSSVFLSSEDLNKKLPKLINQLKVNDAYTVNDIIQIDDFNNYLTPDMQHEVLRILQELTNNIVKYAEAKNILIEMAAFNNGINIKVCDDGKGFDTAQKKKGIGLKNISKRITNLSGEYELITAENKGCTWKIFIPTPLHYHQLSS